MSRPDPDHSQHDHEEEKSDADHNDDCHGVTCSSSSLHEQEPQHLIEFGYNGVPGKNMDGGMKM